jgi:WD40 repeat protein
MKDKTSARMKAVETGELIQTLIDSLENARYNLDTVWCVCYSPNNKKIISGCNTGVKIFSVKTGKFLSTLANFKGSVYAVCCLSCPSYELVKRLTKN